MSKLKTSWGFECSCKLCTSRDQIVEESDSRLEQIRSLAEQLRDRSGASTASPQMAELLISLCKQERLWSFMSLAYYYAALEWNGAGNMWKALEYARLSIEESLQYAPGDLSLRRMRSLVDDPTEHWSWGFRLRNRAFPIDDVL